MSSTRRQGNENTTRLTSRIATALVASCLALVGAEGALRVAGYEPTERPLGVAQYDPLLGWVPVAGRLGPEQQSARFEDGIRSNGRLRPSGPCILAVGDSFTMGAQVHDRDTWPSWLEAVLGRCVLNGGVAGYGLDQIVLRAEQLVERFRPEIVVLLTYPDDVVRCRYRERQYPKPFFAVEAGRLALRNVPVPRTVPGPIQWAAQVSALGELVRRQMIPGSFLEAPGPPPMDEVSRLLIHRLSALNVGMQYVVLFGHPWDPMDDLDGVRRGAAEVGIGVLDLGELPAELFVRRTGHFTPAGNRFVASKVARLVGPK